MFYYSTLFTGIEEIGPVNEIELLAFNMMRIVALIFTSNLLGEITNLIANLKMKQAQQENQVDTNNSVMRNMGLSNETQDLITSYLRKTQSSMEL